MEHETIAEVTSALKSWQALRAERVRDPGRWHRPTLNTIDVAIGQFEKALRAKKGD